MKTILVTLVAVCALLVTAQQDASAQCPVANITNNGPCAVRVALFTGANIIFLSPPIPNTGVPVPVPAPAGHQWAGVERVISIAPCAALINDIVNMPIFLAAGPLPLSPPFVNISSTGACDAIIN